MFADLMIRSVPRHWQLRSLIGAEKSDTIYYPAGGKTDPHIKKLNTTTCNTETVKPLPFQPRCLVARNRWVCCGGEHGEFAAVNLDEEDNSADPGARLAQLGADIQRAAPGPAPTSSDASSRLNADLLSLLAGASDQRPSDKNVAATSSKHGVERVNCITLWFPPTLAKPFEGTYSESVAVLANNDHSVTIVSLNTQEAKATVTYPDCVNRAVLSPDGRLLIAISDDPYLYVHELYRQNGGPFPGAASQRTGAFTWRSRNKIHLKSQKKDDKTDNRGSFAACFSSTGTYLAVGTQYGTISIFDTRTLVRQGADSLITSFTSSRPHADLGAVRDMAFAPGPFDLLAWTEDRGRVGVADVRTGFACRQVLELDDSSSFEHLALIDTTSIDPRLLDRRFFNRRDGVSGNERMSVFDDVMHREGDAPSTSNSGAPADTSAERYNQPLTADEIATLLAVRNLPSSVHPNFERARRLPYSPSRPRERSASVSRAVNEIMGNLREQRERLRDSQERLRAAVRDESDAQRRLRAVVGDETDSESRQPAAGLPPYRRMGGALRSTAMATDTSAATADAGTGSSRRTLERLVASNPGAFGGWVDLDVLHNYIVDSETRTDARGAGNITAAFRRDADDSPLRQMQMFRTSGPDPLDTAGLSWSEDGRTL